MYNINKSIRDYYHQNTKTKFFKLISNYSLKIQFDSKIMQMENARICIVTHIRTYIIKILFIDIYLILLCCKLTANKICTIIMYILHNIFL